MWVQSALDRWTRVSFFGSTSTPSRSLGELRKLQRTFGTSPEGGRVPVAPLALRRQVVNPRRLEVRFIILARTGLIMGGEGPFLWLSENGPLAGFRKLPPGGMCLSAFLFVRRDGRVLLGKYKDDPAWESLAGLDPERRQVHSQGWTIPARQLKYGEDPRDAARSIGEEILQAPGMAYAEPRVEVDLYEPRRFPGQLHYDVWFLVDAQPTRGQEIQRPPWYAELAWKEPAELQPAEYSRGHEDVVARWLQARPGRGARYPAPRTPSRR